MRMKYLLITSVLAFGYAIAAWGQQSATPQTKPADSGPTLPATMQFIQEKLNERGRIAGEETISSTSGVITYRVLVQLSDVMADPAACTLYTTETVDRTVEVPKGKVLKPGASLENLHTITTETDTISFKQIEKITVEKLQDMQNQTYAEAAHPEIAVMVTPPVFYVKIWASNAVFSIHNSTVKGSQTPVENDTTSKTNGFTFRDEESANHLAKAMIHAMELCGGGVTKKELF